MEGAKSVSKKDALALKRLEKLSDRLSVISANMNKRITAVRKAIEEQQQILLRRTLTKTPGRTSKIVRTGRILKTPAKILKKNSARSNKRKRGGKSKAVRPVKKRRIKKEQSADDSDFLAYVNNPGHSEPANGRGRPRFKEAETLRCLRQLPNQRGKIRDMVARSKTLKLCTAKTCLRRLTLRGYVKVVGTRSPGKATTYELVPQHEIASERRKQEARKKKGSSQAPVVIDASQGLAPTPKGGEDFTAAIEKIVDKMQLDFAQDLEDVMEPIPTLSPPPCSSGCPSPTPEGMSSLPPLADIGADSVQAIPILDLPPITQLGDSLKDDDSVSIMPLPPCTALDVDSPLEISKTTPRLPEICGLVKQTHDTLPIMSFSPDLATHIADEDEHSLGDSNQPLPLMPLPPMDDSQSIQLTGGGNWTPAILSDIKEERHDKFFAPEPLREPSLAPGICGPELRAPSEAPPGLFNMAHTSLPVLSGRSAQLPHAFFRSPQKEK